MQQQFVLANLDKMEFLDPSAFGGGGSFWAVAKNGHAASVLVILTAYTNRPMPNDPEFDHPEAVNVFGRWAGDRIALIGDCHTPSLERDPVRQGFPAYNDVIEGYLDISSIIHAAWNRLAEDVGGFLPVKGEAQPMEESELRALVAGQSDLRRRGASLAVRKTSNTRFVVASSTGQGREYVVSLQADHQTCTCPVNEIRQGLCKHIVRAADFALMTAGK
jgi:hypothetical protein